MSEKPSVHVCVEHKYRSGDVAGALLTDDGEYLWGHMSSSVEWLRSDLTTGFTPRRAELERRYPADGYDVQVHEDGPPDWLLDKNQQWSATQEEAS